MKVTKFKNGNINLKCDDGEKNFNEIANNDGLFWNDLHLFVSSMDGWAYLYDTNKNNLYCMTDYGYDNIADLLKGDMVKVMPLKMDEESCKIVEAQY
jgi:translation initiation factor IF-1